MAPSGPNLELWFRASELTDLLKLVDYVLKHEGDPKQWCRLIGHWHPKHLTGVTAADDERPRGLLLGHVKGHYFHVHHFSIDPDMMESSLAEELWDKLVRGVPKQIRSILWTVDERDTGLHKLLSKGFRMKAMGIARDWYAKGHHGIKFKFPIGEIELGGKP